MQGMTSQKCISNNSPPRLICSHLNFGRPGSSSSMSQFSSLALRNDSPRFSTTFVNVSYETELRLIWTYPHPLQVVPLLLLRKVPCSSPIWQSPNRAVTGTGTRCSQAPDCLVVLGKLAHFDLSQKWELWLLQIENAR